MQVPLELTFRHLDKSPAVEALIRKRVEKLEQFRQNIISCRVLVERPHQHESSGSPYRVLLILAVPLGKNVVVDSRPGQHELGESLQTIVNRTFETAERRLKRLTERQRGDIKAEAQRDNLGLVRRKFKEGGYGFLESLDNEDVYFHRNSVLHGDFERLEAGTMVRFEAELGDEGLQATSVQIVDKPGARATEPLSEPTPLVGT